MIHVAAIKFKMGSVKFQHLMFSMFRCEKGLDYEIHKSLQSVFMWDIS